MPNQQRQPHQIRHMLVYRLRCPEFLFVVVTNIVYPFVKRMEGAFVSEVEKLTLVPYSFSCSKGRSTMASEMNTKKNNFS